LAEDGGGERAAGLAVEAASELAGPARVAVTGISQGGGLALAAAALVPQVVTVKGS
jgi:cephalosporin-C deacetylase-like acetyl esterase